MKEIKPNQPHPSEELLDKIRWIAYYKSMVSLAYRGEFNKFGVYVQSKDTYGEMKDKYQPTTSKTVYMAGGKFIPNLIFTEVTKDPPLEYPYEIYDGLDIMAPDYDERAKQRENDYRNRLNIGEISETETLINKYKPGSWEDKLDLLWKFTEEFAEKYVGQDYP